MYCCKITEERKMKIIALQEGNYIADAKKEFKLITEKTSDPGLKMAIQPFLIITNNDVILLDLGLGFVNDGIPFIHQMLRQHNIEPEQITKVLVSHLHKDHIETTITRTDNGFEATPGFNCNFPVVGIIKKSPKSECPVPLKCVWLNPTIVLSSY